MDSTPIALTRTETGGDGAIVNGGGAAGGELVSGAGRLAEADVDADPVIGDGPSGAGMVPRAAAGAGGAADSERYPPTRATAVESRAADTSRYSRLRSTRTVGVRLAAVGATGTAGEELSRRAEVRRAVGVRCDVDAAGAVRTDTARDPRAEVRRAVGVRRDTA